MEPLFPFVPFKVTEVVMIYDAEKQRPRGKSWSRFFSPLSIPYILNLMTNYSGPKRKELQFNLNTVGHNRLLMCSEGAQSNTKACWIKRYKPYKVTTVYNQMRNLTWYFWRNEKLSLMPNALLSCKIHDILKRASGRYLHVVTHFCNLTWM